MQEKNLYHVIGVTQTATQSEIRQAYLIRSKLLHPDRFDQQSQRAEWLLANEMLKELNHAFSVLRDPVSRAAYDQRFVDAARPHPRPDQSSKRQPKNGDHTATASHRPREGAARFDLLPTSTQAQLLSQIDSADESKNAVRLAGVGGKYFWAFCFAGWPVVVFLSSQDTELSEGDLGVLGCITLVVVLLQSWIINWILRWHSSRLKCWFIVTPLYVVKTHLDRVWYWQLPESSNIAVTHSPSFGLFQDSLIRFRLGASYQEMYVPSRAACESLLGRIRSYRSKLARAAAAQDWMYFIAHDYFRDAPSTAQTLPHLRVSGRATGVFMVVFLVYGIAFALMTAPVGNRTPLSDVAEGDNPYIDLARRMSDSERFTRLQTDDRSTQPIVGSEAPSTNSGRRSSGREYVRPVAAPNGQPWPAVSGYVPGYPGSATNGSSTITIDNTRNSSDVFLKLISLESGKMKPVRFCYIKAFSDFKLKNVAPGRFDVRYQDLSLGSFSKTEEFSIVETKTSRGTEFTDLRLTLYKVSNGNMVTEQIDPSEF